MKKINIRQKILDTAESLIQNRGYNAFSYRDIAKVVGVKTSTLHYYFPTKEELGKTVVQDHIKILNAEVGDIISNTSLSNFEKLNLFFEKILAKTYMNEHRMCLGGMLASDLTTLPNDLQKEVKDFFLIIEEGIKQLLLAGLKAGDFSFDENTVEQEASFITSTIEGSLLLTRLFQDETRFENGKEQIKARLLIKK